MEQLIAKHNRTLKALKTSFRRSLADKIPWEQPLIGIIGARGVGKTTMLLQHIHETYGFSNECLYISLDEISFPYESLAELADEFTKQGGRYLFIDEIHKYPNWSQELKNIYDTYRELKVAFTGSSILDIYKGQADLSRRALVFNMQGLSFREFLQVESGKQFDIYSLTDIIKNHAEIAIDIYNKVKPFQYFSDYLKHGYYPYYLQGKEFYHLRLSNVMNQIVETDLAQIVSIDSLYISKLKRFLNLLSNDIPYKPNISSLAAAIGVSWQLVIKYLNFLNKAELIQIMHHAGKNISVLAKPEKVYLHHPNLYYVFKNEISNKGNLRETFFVNQLCYEYKVELAKQGDFIVENEFTFEVGGKNKTYHQIANIENSFIAAGEIEFGYKNKIPLWLFGFLY